MRPKDTYHEVPDPPDDNTSAHLAGTHISEAYCKHAHPMYRYYLHSTCTHSYY
jgi:hypothetical protein